MSELSITLRIGGRTYPLTIDRSEEETIRRAAKNINESIKELEENYAVKDMQDLLAMTCLKISTKDVTESPAPDVSGLKETLQTMDDKLDSYLTED